MAEYCLDCYNRIYKKKFKKSDVKLCLDICEGCKKFKMTIVYIKRSY